MFEEARRETPLTGLLPPQEKIAKVVLKLQIMKLQLTSVDDCLFAESVRVT